MGALLGYWGLDALSKLAEHVKLVPEHALSEAASSLHHLQKVSPSFWGAKP